MYAGDINNNVYQKSQAYMAHKEMQKHKNSIVTATK